MKIRKARLTAWGIAAAAAIAVLPFLLLCAYWHPVGTHAVDWISNWGGRYEKVSYWAQQLDWYRTTMGRYTSTALLSTTHHWYSLPVARCVFLALHLLLGGAVYYCVRGVFRAALGVHLVITLAVLALYVSNLSNPYDSLYRLTGLLIYQTGLIATLLLAGLLCRGKVGWAAVAVVFAAGTNEISLVQCGGLLIGLVVYRPELLRRSDTLVLLATAIFAATVALAAPGNWVRAALYQTSTHSLPESFALVVATGLFTWLSWLSSTALLPLILVGSSFLPRVTLSRKNFLLLGTAAIVAPPISFTPVLLATRAESFPEGIADWQIIPVALLLSVLVASRPRYLLSTWQSALLVVLIGLVGTLGRVSIDRRRDGAVASPWERIVLTAPPGRAWQQLLSGRSAAYSASVERQYGEVRRCTQGICRVSSLEGQFDNYLYDVSYDRRSRAGGDVWFGYLVNHSGVTVVSQHWD
ncbi:hypothetical protein [Neolewinella sp.]|uniref:hypothetical protein n=1 Tax=Neolewinella sp. TaxID=2993543 RepID=UPI003B521039